MLVQRDKLRQLIIPARVIRPRIAAQKERHGHDTSRGQKEETQSSDTRINPLSHPMPLSQMSFFDHLTATSRTALIYDMAFPTSQPKKTTEPPGGCKAKKRRLCNWRFRPPCENAAPPALVLNIGVSLTLDHCRREIDTADLN